jgi:hypothetical protein
MVCKVGAILLGFVAVSLLLLGLAFGWEWMGVRRNPRILVAAPR